MGRAARSLADPVPLPCGAVLPNRIAEAYSRKYASAIRDAAAGVPLMVSGGFRTPAAMETAVAAGEVDVVGIGRPFCVAPGFPRALLAGDRAPLPAPELGWWRGGHLGTASPSATVRALHAQAATAWCYAQQVRLAEGREPDLRLRPPVALARHLAREAVAGPARRARAIGAL